MLSDMLVEYRFHHVCIDAELGCHLAATRAGHWI
jgi:hypothetical protein